MNHTCFPKEDHLPDWERRDNKVTKGNRAEYINGLGKCTWEIYDSSIYLSQTSRCKGFSGSNMDSLRISVPAYCYGARYRSYIICHHHHYHLAIMQLGHVLTRSGFTHPEVSSRISPGSFCLLIWSFFYYPGQSHIRHSINLYPVSSVVLYFA